MKLNIKRLHLSLTLMSVVMLLVIIYNNFFQPVHFYETSYKYQAADSTYMHDVAINVSIKGNHFTSDIIIRELVKSENKNYYNVIGHGDIIQKNTHQYYLNFDNIDVYTGTNKANMKPYKEPTSISSLINKSNNIRVVYLSEEYVVVEFFFYDGQ
ncbi:hypothetical protein D1E84_25175, partial [Vibrio parahaemolyticus]|nr:hypothetical protein [Vibrio parahaemolyticus]